MSGFMPMNDAALTDGIIGRRIIGALIDGFILGLVWLALHTTLWILGFLTFGLGWYLATGLWVVPIAYIFIFVASPGQATPGQAMVGLRVVDNATLGRPSPAQALVYALLYELSLWLGAVWLLVGLFTRRFRCLHDIVSGVLVARADAITLSPETAWTLAGGPYAR
jgi:uncharacterized RDD family membrane protein YckC